MVQNGSADHPLDNLPLLSPEARPSCQEIFESLVKGHAGI